MLLKLHSDNYFLHVYLASLQWARFLFLRDLPNILSVWRILTCGHTCSLSRTARVRPCLFRQNALLHKSVRELTEQCGPWIAWIYPCCQSRGKHWGWCFVCHVGVNPKTVRILSCSYISQPPQVLKSVLGFDKRCSLGKSTLIQNKYLYGVSLPGTGFQTMICSTFIVLICKPFGCQGYKWINKDKWIKISLETACGSCEVYFLLLRTDQPGSRCLSLCKSALGGKP